MPHEVKMPQLGMTQDSGVIVSWLKVAGDSVVEGDALFEVETDKATMEVEAQAGGFLTGISAAEGDDVPVGDVIALIVEDESDVARHNAAPSEVKTKEPEAEKEAEAPAKAAPAPEPSSTPEPAPIPAPSTALPPSSGKVLASPKAKRLALEKGIDLSALRAQGVSEPIHAADLSNAVTGGHSVLTASVSSTALDALLTSSECADRSALFAAFAAGAWRALFNSDTGILLRTLDGSTTMSGAEPAVLTLVDLCDTRLTGYAPAGGGTTLTTAQQGDGYSLTLSFSETALPMAHAAALLDDIAARVEDPIRQLL